MFSGSHRIFVWIARSAGIGLTVLAAIVALDAFEGRPLFEGLAAFAIHLLPAAVVGAVVLLGWRRPWLGALGFSALAIAYIASVPSRLDWIAVVAGPLVVTSVLFALSALSKSRQIDQATGARP
jgi:hypothetical protein